jgi:sec-independent protein translocase protein TatA
MFGISGEHIVILTIILLIFGPKRLPELGNTLGKALKNFKDSMNGIQEAQYKKIEDKSNAVSSEPIQKTETQTPSTPKA